MQIRLENAQERVNNAQDRFTDAQDKVNALIKAGKRGTDDYIAAQKELDRASRALIISENNQERVQNAVVGTYIQMGVQSLNLIKALPELIAYIRTLTASSMAFIATPLGAALLAIGAAVALISYDMKKGNELAKEWAAAQVEIADRTEAIKTSQNHLNDAMWIYEQAIAKVGEQFSNTWKGMSTDEAQLLYDIADARRRGDDEEVKSLQEKYDNNYSYARNAYEALAKLVELQAQNEKGLNQDVEDF